MRTPEEQARIDAAIQSYQTRLFTEITHTLACIANGTDIAAGTLRQDLRQLLTEYATAGFVIFRCPGKDCDHTPFPVTNDSLADADGWIECEYCPSACDRLLSDGTWQSQAARLEEMK